MSFFIDYNKVNKYLDSLKNRKKDNKVEEVTHTNIIIDYQPPKYLSESHKVLRLLLEQDRGFRSKMLPKKEMSFLKDYIKNVNESEINEVLERQKELEINDRFFRVFKLSVPEDKLELITNNLNNEMKVANKINDDLTSTREKKLLEIEKLKQEVKEIESEMDEVRSCILNGEVLETYLDNPNSEEFGTRYGYTFEDHEYPVIERNGLEQRLAMLGKLNKLNYESGKRFYNKQNKNEHHGLKVYGIHSY